MKQVIIYAFLLVIVCLSGCQLREPYTPPCVQVPPNWKYPENAEASNEQFNNWWEIFHDEQLNKLEYQALENNPNVYAAFERVVQARALAGIAKSYLYPEVDLNPTFFSLNVLWMLYDPVRVIREHRRRNQMPLTLRYELDLWGKLQSAYDSEVFASEAQEWEFQASMLMLTADLAKSYFHLRRLDAELQLLEKTSVSRKQAYDILASRNKAKIINYSDVSRAEAEYASTQSQYFRILRLRNLEENKISLLTGSPPELFKIEQMPLVQPPPVIPAGIPSDILVQRPDIAAAERNIAAQYATIGVAYGSFFPSLSLTTAFGFSSPEFKDFMKRKSRYKEWEVDADQVVFDAGKLSFNLKIAESQFREANDEYQQTILVALREVDDALANLEGLNNEIGSIRETVSASKKTNQIASDRYKKGVTFYLDVVDSERHVLEAERYLIEVMGQQYEGTVQLIQALGGSWSSELTEPL